MIHTLLGPQRFRRGTDLYFDRHDGAAVTTEDFVRAMEDANGFDLTQFRRWYSQAGTPVVAVHSSEGPGELHVRFAQSCPATPGQRDKAPFHIPFALGLIDGNGRELLGAAGRDAGSTAEVRSSAVIENPRGDGTVIVHLTEPTTEVRITGLRGSSTLSLLRDFSAPVKVEYARPTDELLFLARNDSDGFGRWDAMQSLHTTEIERIRTGGVEPGRPLLALYRDLLDDAIATPTHADRSALFAAMLAVPSEVYLSELMLEIDVDGLHGARTELRAALANGLFEGWTSLYRTSSSASSYNPDATSIARRALRNLALSFLCAAGERHTAEVQALLLSQFDTADNLTDRLAALREIVDSAWLDSALREQALAKFHTRWSREKLVIDQWYSVQATCPRPGALARVEALEAQPDFDGRNPNRLRALYGGFGAANPVNFHARDGSGYGFLAERVARIDRANPQTAARLLAPLTRWRRYDAARGAAMRQALRTIEATPSISRDVFEVVTKSLQVEG